MAKKILVVEDERHVADYLENIFQDHGFETLTAASAEQGLDLAREIKPDLITLDLQMPQEHGTKFYQKFRKDDVIKDIPIVVITGQFSPHRAINPEKVLAIVNKPFEPDQLMEIITGAIGDA